MVCIEQTLNVSLGQKCQSICKLSNQLWWGEIWVKNKEKQCTATLRIHKSTMSLQHYINIAVILYNHSKQTMYMTNMLSSYVFLMIGIHIGHWGFVEIVKNIIFYMFHIEIRLSRTQSWAHCRHQSVCKCYHSDCKMVPAWWKTIGVYVKYLVY